MVGKQQMNTDERSLDLLRQWAVPPGLPKLRALADKFCRWLEGGPLADVRLESLLREFIACVSALETAEGRDQIIWLADRCGQIRGELKFAIALDRQTETRRLDLVERSRPYVLGSKQPRLDALGVLIAEAMRQSPNASAMELIDAIERIDGGCVIQEIDRDDPDKPLILWRANGAENRTTYKAFQNRLPRIRKKMQSGEIPGFD